MPVMKERDEDFWPTVIVASLVVLLIVCRSCFVGGLQGDRPWSPPESLYK